MISMYNQDIIIVSLSAIIHPIDNAISDREIFITVPL